MSSISPPLTDPGMSNPGTTVIHIHGEVTVKFNSLTINNGTLSTAATKGSHHDQDRGEDPEVRETTLEKQEPDQSPGAPEVQVAWEGNRDDGGEAENDRHHPLRHFLANTNDICNEDLPAAKHPGENHNDRGLYSECRQTGCDEQLGNMFEREEHEVTTHFLCGDCDRKFTCLKDIREHRSERLSWDPVSCGPEDKHIESRSVDCEPLV